MRRFAIAIAEKIKFCVVRDLEIVLVGVEGAESYIMTDLCNIKLHSIER